VSIVKFTDSVSPASLPKRLRGYSHIQIGVGAAIGAGLRAGGLCVRLLVCAVMLGCGLWNPAGSLDYKPSRLPMGELTIGVWLPAGLEAFRFGAEDQERLAQLGINRIEWLQRAVVDSVTAEEIAMGFCDRVGLRMPVYYEPRGFSPYDKLHNWARAKPAADFEAEVRRRVRLLKEQWSGSPGFWGYLIGHEDYRKEYYQGLAKLVEVLRDEDAARPAISVGRLDHYQKVDRFFDALFVEGGTPNVFQQEHYIFRGDVPLEGKGLKRRLDKLVEGYDRVARKLQERHGRWHAIVQVHGETREGVAFYRKPTAAEMRVQVGLALSRGAAGVVYFLYSSGLEEVRDGEGNVVERRYYEGLVERDGTPAEGYEGVRQINATLRKMAPALEELHFHGGFSHRRMMMNRLLLKGDDDLEFGLFGDGTEATHLLVVNRRTVGKRTIELGVDGEEVLDASTGDVLEVMNGRVRVDMEAGGFKLLQINQGEE
jgi:hypothetical protein